MKWQGLPAAIFLFASSLCASAQLVQVSAQTVRDNFLLYERVDVLVTLTNLGNADVELANDGGHSWLSFQVMGEFIHDNFLPVHTERQSSFAPVTLKANETKTLRVNITPLYSFRSEGNYRVSAVVDVPGEGEVVSDPSSFNVQRGRVVAHATREVDSAQRIYSLVRFSPSSDETNLYLRVEAPTENIVYANYALGELVSSVDPTMFFDPQGNVHVLQPSALGTYLYSRVDPDGKILDQRIFKTLNYVRPRLTKLDDGSVVVAGGLSEDPNAPRARLSDAQPGGNKLASPIAPPDPAGTPASVPPSIGP